MSDDYKAQLLLQRVTRLQTFANAFKGHRNPLIEHQAYLVLEVYESPARAIWRYIKWKFRVWLSLSWTQFKSEWKYWWHRATGCDHNGAVERVCAPLNERFK